MPRREKERAIAKLKRIFLRELKSIILSE